jgi:hypothetical protein
MNKQKKNDKTPSGEPPHKQAGPIDDVEEGDERIEEGEETKKGQPGGGRHSESEKPDSPESRWGSDQES